MSTHAFVYSMTRVGQVGAWSRYVFPFDVDDWVIAGNTLYLRAGDAIYEYDPSALGDEVEPGVIEPFPGLIQWAWLDWGAPGVDKMVHGFDVVGRGDVSVSFGFDQRNKTLFTPPYMIPEDTLTGEMVAMPLAAPSLSVRLAYDGTKAWEWNAFALYAEAMR